MAQYVSNPRVTLNIIPRDDRIGPEDHRALIVGQMTTGTAQAGALVSDVPRTDAEINAIFGADSHVAMVARWFRKVNQVTNLDVIALADAPAASKGAATVTFAGAATAEGTLYFTFVSGLNHRYQIDLLPGDDPAAILLKLAARVNADTVRPFTYADDGISKATLTAVNAGNISDGWPIIVEGAVAGVTVTLTGWSGGATDPDLATLFDPVQNIRYQTVIYPEAWDQTTLRNFIDPRKNVDNNVMDGRAFVWRNQSFINVKASALSGATGNSSEIVVLTNEPVDAPDWKGCYLPEAPDCLAANFAAARARRFEDDVSISDIIVTNEPRDQFGGMHTASLPYFNTPFLYVRPPKKGAGYSYEEQVELEDAGVTVVGANREHNAVIAGQVVTTWQNDAAGNADETWKYLNWRDTHGMIREYEVLNVRKEFSQYRLTTGSAVPGFAIADEATIRSYIYQLYNELADQTLTVEGREARLFHEQNLVVKIVPEQRQAQIHQKVPMVSQLGEIIGTVKYTFTTA